MIVCSCNITNPLRNYQELVCIKDWRDRVPHPNRGLVRRKLEAVVVDFVSRELTRIRRKVSLLHELFNVTGVLIDRYNHRSCE